MWCIFPEGRKYHKKRNWKMLPKLLEQFNWRCHWCGQIVMAPPKNVDQSKYKVPEFMATVDHVYDRLDVRRGIDGGKSIVLACHKCNQGNRTQEKVYRWYKEEHDIFDIRDLLTNQPQPI